jgi:hypothetical protein
MCEVAKELRELESCNPAFLPTKRVFMRFHPRFGDTY